MDDNKTEELIRSIPPGRSPYRMGKFFVHDGLIQSWELSGVRDLFSKVVVVQSSIAIAGRWYWAYSEGFREIGIYDEVPEYLVLWRTDDGGPLFMGFREVDDP